VCRSGQKEERGIGYCIGIRGTGDIAVGSGYPGQSVVLLPKWFSVARSIEPLKQKFPFIVVLLLQKHHFGSGSPVALTPPQIPSYHSHEFG
jgi:hypothetical protein